MKIKKIKNGKLSTNSYLVYNEDLEALIIDPADDTEKIINTIDELNLKLKYIVNTHGHSDHVAGNKDLADKYNCEIIISKKDAAMLERPSDNLSLYLGIKGEQPSPDRLVEENDVIKLGDIKLVVIETPGHTKGSVSLFEQTRDVLFSGDTLFHRSVGRTDLPGGSIPDLLNSLKKLFNLPGRVTVYPGHSETTKIEFERENNPFAKKLG
ncbi:MAG: MBL fold metallo-hydrolase [Clostridia bacterium]